MPICIKCGKSQNDVDISCIYCGAHFQNGSSVKIDCDYVYQEEDREQLLFELLSAAEASISEGSSQSKSDIQRIANIKQLPLDIKASALGVIGEVLSLENEYEKTIAILEEAISLGRENGWALSNQEILLANTLGKAYFLKIESLLTEKELVEARKINKKYEKLIELYIENEEFKTTSHQVFYLFNKGRILVKSQYFTEAVPIFEQVISEKYRQIIKTENLQFIIGISYRILALSFRLQCDDKKAIKNMLLSFKYTEGEEEIMDLALAFGKYYPDHVLNYIENLDKKEAEAWNFAKAMAYLGKGLPALMTFDSVNISYFTEKDFKEKLGLNDTHLDCLEKSLFFFRKHLDKQYGSDDLNSSWSIEDYMEDIDNTCRALERCRPTKVLKILGMTKINYYSPDQIFIDKEIKQHEHKLAPYMNLFFKCPFEIKSIILNDYNDESGYIIAALYQTSEIFNQDSEQNPIACMMKIYSDGMYYYL